MWCASTSRTDTSNLGSRAALLLVKPCSVLKCVAVCYSDNNSLCPVGGEAPTHCDTLQDVRMSHVWHVTIIHNDNAAATHGNTLQHTATDCNTCEWVMSDMSSSFTMTMLLQHTATHCNTLQHTAPHHQSQCCLPSTAGKIWLSCASWCPILSAPPSPPLSLSPAWRLAVRRTWEYFKKKIHGDMSWHNIR